MARRTDNARGPAGEGVLRGVFGDRHFLIAAVILSLSAGGWGMTITLLKWATYKEPVSWPACVRVDPDNRRLLTLPERFGPYVLRRDNGEIILEDMTLELLGIKTAYDDSARVTSRRSNWYVSRVYHDTRPSAEPRAWRLSIYYYTGGLDKVPHVPERCMVADGARWLDSRAVAFEAPGAPPPWDGEVAFRRALFARSGQQFVQYYLFSLNGRPERSWEVVRATLSLSPWMRHCYFAKIQFAPYGQAADLAETDRAAAEFAKHFLAGALRQLPMPEDIRELSGQR